MLKAIVSYSKKIPAEAEYSSQGYSLSLEAEIPETDSTAIRERLHRTFELVKASVEQELANGNSRPSSVTAPADGVDSRPAAADKASNKQIKYLTDLASQHGITITELNARAKDLYHVSSIYDLTKRDASRFVDSLRTGGRRQAA